MKVLLKPPQWKVFGCRERFRVLVASRRFGKTFLALTELKIARRLGIRSVKTLRRHFREELDRGSLDANTTVAQSLYQMAKSGQHPVATMFWLKCRAGWKDRSAYEPQAAPPPPFVVAKDDGAQQP